MDPNLTLYDLTEGQKLRLLLATASPNLPIDDLRARERFVLGVTQPAAICASRDSLDKIDAELRESLLEPPVPLCEMTPQPPEPPQAALPMLDANPEPAPRRVRRRWSDEELVNCGKLLDETGGNIDRVATQISRTNRAVEAKIVQGRVPLLPVTRAALEGKLPGIKTLGVKS